jgi:prolyl-tRNA synthetase
MLFTNLFTKTSKDIPGDEVSKNGKLLFQAGFVDKTMAGVYSYLPLGLRVLNKIENIVRKHLNKIGAQEILMNTLHPKEWWEATGRFDSVNVLFKLDSQTKTQYAVACSHEEQITPIAKRFISSYKDLPEFDPEKGIFPLSIYQIQTKFRDELRAKSGLLRGREFRMKDMYDFHQTQEDLDKYYEAVKQVYFDIYEELGLEVYAVEATGGDFTDNISHEFQTPCQAGEDIALISKSTGFAINQEILEDYKNNNKKIPDDLIEVKVAEVGNIFKLGDKYTKAFDLKYSSLKNEQKYPVMGCHGIGTSRCMAVIAENWADENGLVWPKSVAPFEIHLITNFSKNDEQINKKILETANKIHNQELRFILNQNSQKYEIVNINNLTDVTNFAISDLEIATKDEVLWDNRDKISIGQKLKDADLIGCPTQIIISERSLKEGGIEVRNRKTKKSEIIRL